MSLRCDGDLPASDFAQLRCKFEEQLVRPVTLVGRAAVLQCDPFYWRPEAEIHVHYLKGGLDVDLVLFLRSGYSPRAGPKAFSWHYTFPALLAVARQHPIDLNADGCSFEEALLVHAFYQCHGPAWIDQIGSAYAKEIYRDIPNC